MKYLGIDPNRPKVGVFDFTGCEGCQLQLTNKEDSLVDFFRIVEITSFREISSEDSEAYDVALLDGAITSDDEIARLRRIRDKSHTLIALGSCACYGGVNRMKNELDPAEARRVVYGDHPIETLPTMPIGEVVPVELEIPGCPVNMDEVERVFQHLIFDVPYRSPVYPVCLECKQRFAVCTFQLGQLCLGPITRGGCNAPCPAGGLGCWGCRGPAADPNYEEMFALARRHGHGDRELAERVQFFGAFGNVL